MTNCVQERANFFPVVDDWITFNVYSGYQFLDNALIEIEPTISKLLENKDISSFMFIRYHDPDPHIRLRFKISSSSDISILLSYIKQRFAKAIEHSIIWKISITGYQREINRYGKSSIDLVEEVFFQSSLLILKRLPAYRDRLHLSLLLFNAIVNLLGLELREKLHICKSAKEGFMQEYEFTKEIKQTLGKKFIAYEDELREVLENKYYEDYLCICSMLHAPCKKLKDFFKTQPPEFSESILTSILHMNFNRVFVNNGRKNEAIVYYILDRYYSKVLNWK